MRKFSLRNGILFFIIFLLLLPLAGHAIKLIQPSYAPEVVAFHDTKLVGMNGTTLSQLLADHHAPQAVLFMYASWCPHCKRQFAIMDELKSQYSPEQLAIYYVAIDADAMELSQFLVDRYPNGVPFTPYHAAPGTNRDALEEALRSMGMHPSGSIPYLVFFNAQRQPVHEETGVTPMGSLRVILADGSFEKMRLHPLQSQQNPEQPN